jgi:nucleoid DNA-binding protein
MITFQQQYKVISQIWQTFKNNKISEKVRISKEDLDYAKIHYRPERFENYTLDNFKSLLVYIMYDRKPTSKTDFLSLINNSEKSDLIDSLKLKSIILNAKTYLDKDLNVIKRVNTDEFQTIHELYKKDKITLVGFYSFYEKNKDELKGRILKKDFKIVEILLDLFNINKGEIKWQL